MNIEIKYKGGYTSKIVAGSLIGFGSKVIGIDWKQWKDISPEQHQQLCDWIESVQKATNLPLDQIVPNDDWLVKMLDCPIRFSWEDGTTKVYPRLAKIRGLRHNGERPTTVEWVGHSAGDLHTLEWITTEVEPALKAGGVNKLSEYTK